MNRKQGRREFLSASLIGAAATGLMTSCYTGNTDTLRNKFIHHVFFWLKQPLTAETRSKFESELRELVTIETIIDYHLGIPAGTNRDVIDTSYSYSLLTIFRNREDQDVYQTHPRHLRFIENCQDLWEKVVVYDSDCI